MESEQENHPESGFGADWAELAHDCLVNILSRLSLEDRWRGIMLVCKSWLQASKDPFLHSVLNLETHFDSPHPALDNWWSPSELANWWSADFEKRIDTMLRSVVEWSDGSHTEIRVRHCSDGALGFVAESCDRKEDTVLWNWACCNWNFYWWLL